MNYLGPDGAYGGDISVALAKQRFYWLARRAQSRQPGTCCSRPEGTANLDAETEGESCAAVCRGIEDHGESLSRTARLAASDAHPRSPIK